MTNRTAVQQASDNLVSARVSAAVGHEDSISFNRRFFMTEGNYEPTRARCAAGSGEMLVQASMRLLHALKETETDSLAI